MGWEYSEWETSCRCYEGVGIPEILEYSLTAAPVPRDQNATKIRDMVVNMLDIITFNYVTNKYIYECVAYVSLFSWICGMNYYFMLHDCCPIFPFIYSTLLFWFGWCPVWSWGKPRKWKESTLMNQIKTVTYFSYKAVSWPVGAQKTIFNIKKAFKENKKFDNFENTFKN